VLYKLYDSLWIYFVVQFFDLLYSPSIFLHKSKVILQWFNLLWICYWVHKKSTACRDNVNLLCTHRKGEKVLELFWISRKTCFKAFPQQIEEDSVVWAHDCSKNITLPEVFVELLFLLILLHGAYHFSMFAECLCLCTVAIVSVWPVLKSCYIAKIPPSFLAYVNMLDCVNIFFINPDTLFLILTYDSSLVIAINSSLD
jgi:hypothetical protein